MEEPIESHAVMDAVRLGLQKTQKSLPPWLFYDAEGSRLFEAITELPEYYLTRTERSLFARHADAMLEQAAAGQRLVVIELGAGSAEKTRLLLEAALRRQDAVLYEPVDVSESALAAAKERLEAELPRVAVRPRVEDYTRGLEIDAPLAGERRMVLYIGSSIGNFDPAEALELLQGVRRALRPGESLLLGVDQVKDASLLLAAYNDAQGVTAEFNKNILVRLNRELGAEFDVRNFEHRAVWNAEASRIEMHLVSLVPQEVRIAALGAEFRVLLRAGETIHTENSYKYAAGAAEELLRQAGFAKTGRWTDENAWFEVLLGRAAPPDTNV